MRRRIMVERGQRYLQKFLESLALRPQRFQRIKATARRDYDTERETEAALASIQNSW